MRRADRDRELARRFARSINHQCQIEDAAVALIAKVRAETRKDAAKRARLRRKSTPSSNGTGRTTQADEGGASRGETREGGGD